MSCQLLKSYGNRGQGLRVTWDRLEEPRIELWTPGYKASALSTTPQRLLICNNECCVGFNYNTIFNLISNLPMKVTCGRNKIIIDSNEVDMRIYLPGKVIFTHHKVEVNITFKGIDKFSCLPKLKSITVLSYDFLTMNENVLLSFLLLKSCST